MKSTIPDLRADTPEITTEHCYVLLHRVAQALREMDGNPELDSFSFIDEIDPEHLKYHYEDHIPAKTFGHLFKTDFGKNVLVGMFIQKLVQESRNENVDDL